MSGLKLQIKQPEAAGFALVVDIELPDHGITAIYGPSGSGKSTLLHLIGGLDRPDSGTIRVGDARIDDMNESGLTAFRRRGIGIDPAAQPLHLGLGMFPALAVLGTEGRERGEEQHLGRELHATGTGHTGYTMQVAW